MDKLSSSETFTDYINGPFEETSEGPFEIPKKVMFPTPNPFEGDYWEHPDPRPPFVGDYDYGYGYQPEDNSVKKWDFRFLELATVPASWSKDPSRQVGAVIVDTDRSIISVGYNGFARGVHDYEDRYKNKEIKYEMVVHAEINAILSARRDLRGSTLYCTLLPCSRCAAIIINAGIKRVVCLDNDLSVFDNSKVHFDLSLNQFTEAQVELVQYKLSEFTLDKTEDE